MATLESLELALTSFERSLDRERGLVEALAARGELANRRVGEAESRALACEEASRLLAQFADARQSHLVSIIETVTSEGLTQIFGEPISLKIEQVTRARRVEMDIKVKTGDLETSILDARGGGLAAVAGFILRLTILLLTKDARRLILADESFAQLSDEYLVPTAEFLADICNKADVQLILVTHQTDFAEAADTVIRLVKDSTNTSKVVVEK